MIDWFNASSAVEFGNTLADFVIERIPVPSDEGKAKRLDKQFQVVDKMLGQVERFKSDNKLNVYKKAKLIDAFKSRLTGAGYDARLVDEMALGIMKIL